VSVFDMDGRVVLVTGGYGHLGSGMCLGLAEYGARVVVLGRSAEKFRARLGSCAGKAPGGIFFVPCDVASTASIQDAFAQAQEVCGRIDVLVNNAVYVRGQAPLGIDDEGWATTMDGALNSVYRCIREVVPYFLGAGRGKIVNISSMYGMVSPDFRVYDESPAFLNPPHYGAAKAGVIQLTKYFAQYLGRDNIQVNAISPGPFPSAKVQEDGRFVEALAAKTALGRIGRPEDLVGAIVFLSSRASDYVTGHNLVVDGGWTVT